MGYIKFHLSRTMPRAKYLTLSSYIVVRIGTNGKDHSGVWAKIHIRSIFAPYCWSTVKPSDATVCAYAEDGTNVYGENRRKT
jgi:hypothetical protein